MLTATKIIAADNLPYQLVTLTNKNGMQVQLTDWGATILSILVPVKGKLRETVCSCPLSKLAENQAFLGATIGRFANRINQGQFRLAAKTQKIVKNQDNRHTLHGGVGFDKRRWKIELISTQTAILSLFSADGDQGFSGNLQITLKYRLTDDNALFIDFLAKCDQDTALNLTNHSYFNLDEGITDARQHRLQLFADYYLPVSTEGIPNRPLTLVEATHFDFRKAKVIATDFLKDADQKAVGGYDHAFLLQGKNGQLKPAAKLTSSSGDLTLLLSTTHNAIQFYSSNFLAGTPSHTGKYQNYQAIALEPEALPDTPNHPEWYQYGGIQKALQPYYQQIVYQFI
ncbi:galactose-1-epimerase [Gallibacterium anatis]|uniref:galactose-1-epimerase n=1 Tax=Gallibacterium anatis TaxID=750 RepID=UPI0039FB93BD